MAANTLFLRLEGPMQAWGDQQSKFVIRRTSEAPTKSGVLGLICSALGITRSEAPKVWLPKLREIKMGVRIDSPGVRWWDYNTVGAGMRMQIAESLGKTKSGAMLTRREYLCDASFLVTLQGEPNLIDEISSALNTPGWTLYLGRKSCPPSRPIIENPSGEFPDLISAVKSIPWRKRLYKDQQPLTIECFLDWVPTSEQTEAPDDAEIWYDVPTSLDPPSHSPRFVIRKEMMIGENGEIVIDENPAQSYPKSPPRPRADYKNTEYRNARAARLESDHNLCIFCKSPASTVQHITYRRAGGNETQDDLRSLCRLCHDAVTMIEYGMGMGLDRINPEDLKWRDTIIKKRQEIIEFRSMETRRRRLSSEEA